MLKKKIIAALAVAVFSCGIIAGNVSEAKSSGGGRTSGYSRSSSAPKASAPKASVKGNTSGYSKSSSKPAAKSSSGNTNGYKKKENSSTSTSGSSYSTKDGGKVTPAGGNTSGYKSRQTQEKEQAISNTANSRPWYGGANNPYYNNTSSGWGGIGHFATGMFLGSMLSSPWHVYNGAPGYFGGGYAPAGAGGFYSPFSGILGLFVWLIEWAVILGVIYAFYKWWRRRKSNNGSSNSNGYSRNNRYH